MLGVLALLLMTGVSDAGTWWKPNVGNGANGLNGVNGLNLTINNITNMDDGTYRWNFSDGTSFRTGNLTGPRGEQGSSGNNGAAGINGVNGTFNSNIEVLSFGNSSGARLRLAGNYSASPSNPPRGQCDIMFIDSAITPVMRFRCNSSDVMKVADVPLG